MVVGPRGGLLRLSSKLLLVIVLSFSRLSEVVVSRRISSTFVATSPNLSMHCQRITRTGFPNAVDHTYMVGTFWVIIFRISAFRILSIASGAGSSSSLAWR